jgi:hypothetical protein
VHGKCTIAPHACVYPIFFFRCVWHHDLWDGIHLSDHFSNPTPHMCTCTHVKEEIEKLASSARRTRTTTAHMHVYPCLKNLEKKCTGLPLDHEALLLIYLAFDDAVLDTLFYSELK